MKKLVLAGLVAAVIIIPTTTNAQEAECTTVDYQGAPLEICPEQEPDPTNCYTGWYQGAPIEVCLPTGETLPEGATYHDGTPWAGQPVLMHVSKDYVAPPTSTEEVAPVATTPPAPVATAPATIENTDPALWLEDFIALIG